MNQLEEMVLVFVVNIAVSGAVWYGILHGLLGVLP